MNQLALELAVKLSHNHGWSVDATVNAARAFRHFLAEEFGTNAPEEPTAQEYRVLVRNKANQEPLDLNTTRAAEWWSRQYGRDVTITAILAKEAGE